MIEECIRKDKDLMKLKITKTKTMVEIWESLKV